MEKENYISKEIDRLNNLMKKYYVGKSVHPISSYSIGTSGQTFYFILQLDNKAKPTLIGVCTWHHFHHNECFYLKPYGIDLKEGNGILKSILGKSVFEDEMGIGFHPDNLNTVLGLLKPFDITEAIN